jgi:hypothetical protein
MHTCVRKLSCHPSPILRPLPAPPRFHDHPHTPFSARTPDLLSSLVPQTPSNRHPTAILPPSHARSIRGLPLPAFRPMLRLPCRFHKVPFVLRAGTLCPPTSSIRRIWLRHSFLLSDVCEHVDPHLTPYSIYIAHSLFK